jgi:DNA-binding GntR family transcriptional regulator
MSGQRVPSYQRIMDRLAEGIRSGRLVNGQRLLEGELAELFQTSRGPVRQALKRLVSESLARKADGRGYQVTVPGQPTPDTVCRTPVTAEMLGGDEMSATSGSAAEAIYRDVEQAVTLCIPFGHYRIVETALCDHHHVSRTVGREVLQRLQQQGLIEKSMQSHWLAGPVTARDVVQEYDLRLHLEPEALREAAPALPRARLTAMQASLEDCLDNPSQRTFEAIERIERELHSECLSYCPNRKLLSILDHCRLPLVVNHVFYETLKNTERQWLFGEHKLVVDHLIAGSVEAAAEALKAHLMAARERTRARLKVLSVFPEPDLPPYLNRIV